MLVRAKLKSSPEQIFESSRAATAKPHREVCVGLSMTFSIWPMFFFFVFVFVFLLLLFFFLMKHFIVWDIIFRRINEHTRPHS